MISPVPSPRVFRFGVFELDACRGELRKYGLKIRIGQPSLKLLLKLLQCPGQLLSREELGRQLMPSGGCGDSDCSLNKAICQLRHVLGDSASSPRYIETVANEGYRFIPLPESSSVSPAHGRSPRRLEFIAVLPLVSQTVDPEFEYVGAQVVSRVINRLSRMPEMRVLAHSTVKRYRHTEADPQTVGRTLGVQGIVAGEILRHDDNLIVEMELIDTTDGAHLWGMHVEQPWPVTASGTEQIAEQIVRDLQPVLAHKRKPLDLHSRNADETHLSAA
jgi:TolB-like protein